MYDYLFVGAGLFNAVIAYYATQKGKKCLVLERRPHIGGNCYTYDDGGIIVHQYGAHIFHTDDEVVWNFVNQVVPFQPFINSPIAIYKDEVYNLPFNMNTFSKMWKIRTPDEAKKMIELQSQKITAPPQNLEEQAISLVGQDIYEKLVKGYTEKQWGKPCKELPASIIQRIPVRFRYDNNYFDSKYQGIPEGGYGPMLEKMFAKCDIQTNVDYLKNKEYYDQQAEKIIFTGPIDEFYAYKYGTLEYRTLRFETEKIDIENYQGVAVVNYTDCEPKYTRIIEHKHFSYGTQPFTIISREYPIEWKEGMEPYYPINNERNMQLYQQYMQLAQQDKKTIFGGRLGLYRYMDMDTTIQEAMKTWKRILKEEKE